MKLPLSHIPLLSILILLLGVNGILAQPFSASTPGRLVHVINSIPAASKDIEVDSEGNIYLFDSTNNKIFKYLSNYQYDSVLSIGGAGNRLEGFLQIQKIALPNRQQLYVLDEALQEIVILNRDLKKERSLSFWTSDNFDLNEATIQARSFDINPGGDLYILNDLDNKIYMYEASGEFVQNFGGVDYGAGSLYNPKQLWVGVDNQVYVVDGRPLEVKIFDNQGTFQTMVSLESETWERVILEYPFLIYANSSQIVFSHVQTNNKMSYSLQASSTILDVQITKEFIYLLSNNGIYIYSQS